MARWLCPNGFEELYPFEQQGTCAAWLCGGEGIEPTPYYNVFITAIQNWRVLDYAEAVGKSAAELALLKSQLDARFEYTVIGEFAVRKGDGMRECPCDETASALDGGSWRDQSRPTV